MWTIAESGCLVCYKLLVGYKLLLLTCGCYQFDSYQTSHILFTYLGVKAIPKGCMYYTHPHSSHKLLCYCKCSRCQVTLSILNGTLPCRHHSGTKRLTILNNFHGMQHRGLLPGIRQVPDSIPHPLAEGAFYSTLPPFLPPLLVFCTTPKVLGLMIQ